MTFHLYGLIVGIAVITVFLISEKFALNYGFSEKLFSKIAIAILFSSIVGARAWHVFTDFSLYKENFQEIFYLWQGGLSIFGAIFGGWFCLIFLAKKYHFDQKILLDSLAFSLPVGQFIGRWANYFNQELYGSPTSLPWKIFIDSNNRVAGYEGFSYFHPLFLYEGLLSLVGLSFLIYLFKTKTYYFGSGQFFYIYIFYYLFIRFFLDFLRLERSQVIGYFGTNQLVILLIFIFIISCKFLMKWQKN